MKKERWVSSPGSEPISSASSARRSTSIAVPIAFIPTVLSSWVSFSAPRQRTTSWAPAATACQPRCRALAAEAQAFSTLKIGMPSIPSGRSTTWPRIISWPVTRPAAPLPT